VASDVHLGRDASADLEIPQHAVGEPVDDAVDVQPLPAAPGLLHDRRPADVRDLLHDVEAAEQVCPILRGGRREQTRVLVGDILDVAQPVVDQPESASLEIRFEVASVSDGRVERLGFADD